MISITPQGVGFVEVATIGLLAAYGVPAAIGTAVALVYRGLVFWMPFIIGAILIHRTKSFSGGDKDGSAKKRRWLPWAKANKQRQLPQPKPKKRLPPGSSATLLPEPRDAQAQVPDLQTPSGRPNLKQ
jgi:hypothetical protein